MFTFFKKDHVRCFTIRSREIGVKKAKMRFDYFKSRVNEIKDTKIIYEEFDIFSDGFTVLIDIIIEYHTKTTPLKELKTIINDIYPRT